MEKSIEFCGSGGSCSHVRGVVSSSSISLIQELEFVISFTGSCIASSLYVLQAGGANLLIGAFALGSATGVNYSRFPSSVSRPYFFFRRSDSRGL